MRKKALAALLAVCMLASLMFIPASAAGFDDVADDHWAKESIERWAGYGVLNGKAEGKFDPDANMTRAQFAKFIVTLMGLPVDEDAEMPFEDVKGTANDWAAPYIAAAYKAGIIRGTNTAGTRFAPANNVNFDQSAAMLARAVGLVEKDAYGTAVTEKLTELEMLDDNVKADADATRALVAGLANNMIAEYANDPEAEAVVVGSADSETPTEVKGVILAVNGGKINVENATVKAPIVVTSEASVEVKSSTVEAPIVVDSASVALTETKAADVAVSGEKASVTADKDSTVAEVAVSGTAPSVELNGTVEKVTVAEGTTEVEVKGEGVSKENVTNNTGADITVNEETVEPTPAEPENPDDNQGGSTGFVPEPSKPVVPPTNTTEAPHTPQVPGADTVTPVAPDTPKKDEDDNEIPVCGTTGGAAAHTWGDPVMEGATGLKKPTCTATGVARYTCTTCNATSTVTVPALNHAWNSVVTTAPTCTTKGLVTWHCANEGCEGAVKPGTNANKEETPALGHQQVTVPTKAATCTAAGHNDGIACSRAGCEYATSNGGKDAAKYFSGGATIPALGHNYQKKVTGTGDDAVTTYVCSRCNDERETCPNAPHSSILNTTTCPICGERGTKVPPVAHDRTHTLVYDSSKAAQRTADQHPVKCETDNCDYAGGMEDHSYGEWNATTGKRSCSECSYEQTCAHDGARKPNGKADGNTLCAICSGDEKPCTVTEGAGHTTVGACSTCGKVKEADPVTPGQ